MVNFDVGSRLEVSRLEIIHADTHVGLSIDLKIDGATTLRSVPQFQLANTTALLGGTPTTIR